MSDVTSLVRDMQQAFESVQESEPLELRALRTGQNELGPGCFGQYWSAWDFANGMIRDFAMYTVYPIHRLALSGEFSVEQLRAMLDVFHPPYSQYLGYSGYRTMQGFCERLREVAKDIEDVDEFIEIYELFLKYVNKLSAWSYHYFTWDIGDGEYRYAQSQGA
jgi:hypothetical protein